MTAELKAQVYFSHSHSPWERPINENTNGLLRQFFPKYRSFSTVMQEHLDHATRLLNSRPRKCLNWKTPYQALAIRGGKMKTSSLVRLRSHSF
jgi:IS30 family transposase